MRCIRSQVLGLACGLLVLFQFFFSSRRLHTSLQGGWSSGVCSSDLHVAFDKGDFIGRDAALREREKGVHREIGRASCRERVADWGVAPTFEAVDGRSIGIECDSDHYAEYVVM